MPDDRLDAPPVSGLEERTDPGMVSDRILERVLDLVKEQMAEQARTTKRFMILMLVILVVNAGLSGVNLAVQTMGVEVSTAGKSTAVTVSSDGATATVVTEDDPGVPPEPVDLPTSPMVE